MPAPSRLLLALLLLSAGIVRADDALPQLRRHGTATQLVVKGQPLLLRGGELGNSSGEPGYLRPFWPKLRAMNLNTVVAPLYWDQLEPAEGQFDFSTLDGLVHDARANDCHLVLLWFGTWKNSMSCYAPAWMKRDFPRFPRALDAAGTPTEIFSAFSAATLAADEKAFRAVMRHLRETDQRDQTVVLVQVENEIGSIPDARDYAPAAQQQFQQPVPRELTDYLAAHSDTLIPEFRDRWVAGGKKTAGSWNEVFGPGLEADEIFMAWNYARFVNQVASAGKAEYALPMYVNAALIRPGYKPGQYPSAGPLPHLVDVWRAGAPAIDFLAPDIYTGNFSDWVHRYTRHGNPLFIPEALRSAEASVNALYVFADQDAIGFSPFGIESVTDAPAKFLTESYDIVAQLTPLILEHQGDGSMAGFYSQGAEQRQPQEISLGGCVMHVAFDRTNGPGLADGVPAGAATTTTWPAGGLVIATGPDEFLFAGIGVTITFQLREPGGPQVGLLSVEEGSFVDGKWNHVRWLNGDQTNQGRHVKLEPGHFGLQRVRLYRYR